MNFIDSPSSSRQLVYLWDLAATRDLPANSPKWAIEIVDLARAGRQPRPMRGFTSATINLLRRGPRRKASGRI